MRLTKNRIYPRAICVLVFWLFVGGGCLLSGKGEHKFRYAQEMAGLPFAGPADLSVEPFEGKETLTPEDLVRAVLVRNPTIESARQAWRAALARYPQVIAFDDSTISYQSAPGSIGSKHGYSQVIQIGQRVPWPGKRDLRGAVVMAAAEVEQANIEGARKQLALVASLLFCDYFELQRAQEINNEEVTLLERLYSSAEIRYTAGRGSQQYSLQAEVELALLKRQELALAAQQQVLIAQINGLLHRAPAAVLPKFPQTLSKAEAPTATVAELVNQATNARPESHTATHLVDGAVAQVALAEADRFPDVTLVGVYNSMWSMPEHQFMMGLTLNLPIQFERQQAQISEARAQLGGAEAQREQRLNKIRVEVREAVVRFDDAQSQESLYRSRILPAARRQVSAAKAEYQSGRNSFAVLMKAERQLKALELEYQQVFVDTWRRRALLARAVGSTPGLAFTKGVMR